jgi:hypothetical protein
VPPRPLFVCACLLPVACTGPVTHLHNPAGHRLFVDGIEVAPAPDGQRLPHTYYGTSRWDAAPADRDGEPDWSRQPASAAFVRPWPASPWLFPLDFPLEVAHRAVVGRGDQTVVIVLPPTPADLVVPAEVPPAGLGELVDRATAARVQR